MNGRAEPLGGLAAQLRLDQVHGRLCRVEAADVDHGAVDAGGGEASGEGGAADWSRATSTPSPPVASSTVWNNGGIRGAGGRADALAGAVGSRPPQRGAVARGLCRGGISVVNPLPARPLDYIPAAGGCDVQGGGKPFRTEAFVGPPLESWTVAPPNRPGGMDGRY